VAYETRTTWYALAKHDRPLCGMGIRDHAATNSGSHGIGTLPQDDETLSIGSAFSVLLGTNSEPRCIQSIRSASYVDNYIGGNNSSHRTQRQESIQMGDI